MAMLLPYKGGTAGVRLPVDKPLLRIGRDPSNDLQVEDDLASREHAVIERVSNPQREGGFDYVLQDTGSTNGTFVNNERVERRVLTSGDMIRVGKSFLLFSTEEAEEEGLSATMRLHKTFIPGVYYTTTSEKDEKKSK